MKSLSNNYQNPILQINTGISLRIILILLFSKMPATLFSQSDVSLGIYEWNNTVSMHGCERNGKLLTPAYDIENKIKQTFTVLSIDGDTCIIKVIDYFATNSNNYHDIALYNTTLPVNTFVDTKIKKNDSLSSSKTQRYFKVKTSDIKSAAKKVYKKDVQFTMGAVSIPVKLRVQNPFDFSGNFSISAAGGPKFRISKYSENYFDLLLGVGLSNISVDSASRRHSDIHLLPTADLSALTLSLGAVFEFGKAQAGIFIGTDWLSNSSQKTYEWQYHGKPWIGIGFGFSIFGTNQQPQAASNTPNDNPAPKN